MDPPKSLLTADSFVSVLRTTFVFCFLPTSSQPSPPSPLALGDVGLAIDLSSESPLAAGADLAVTRDVCVRERMYRISS